MKLNIKAFLPVLAATVLSIATPSLGNAANQAGDICGTTLTLKLDTTFKCANLFPENKNISIHEIYQRGYRLVAVSTNSQGYTTIIIEKQE